MLTSKENKYKNTNVTSFMGVVLFLFSIHKVVRPADADEIANLAQHQKSLGTAALLHDTKIVNLALVQCECHSGK